MPNLNKVFLIGHLTRDPEMRYTPGGSSVCNFGIATNRYYNGKDGEKHEDVCFVDVTAWGKQADLIHEHVLKGDPIFIEGRLEFQQWQDKSGGKRSKLSVVVEQFQFLGGQRTHEDRPEDFGFGAEAGRKADQVERSQPAETEQSDGDGEEQDDLPF